MAVQANIISIVLYIFKQEAEKENKYILAQVIWKSQLCI